MRLYLFANAIRYCAHGNGTTLLLLLLPGVDWLSDDRAVRPR